MFCSSIDLPRIPYVDASEKSVRTVVHDVSRKGKRDGCLLGEPTRRRPVLPRPVSLRHVAVRRPSRPALGMFGFWIRQVKHIASDNMVSTRPLNIKINILKYNVYFPH